MAAVNMFMELLLPLLKWCTGYLYYLNNNNNIIL